MTATTHEQIILMSLKPLFDEATEKGLWFYHQSNEAGEVWCSPEYLQLQQSNGKLIWAPDHWELRNPLYYMKSSHMRADELVTEYNEMAKRLRFEQTLSLSAVSSNPADAES